MAIARRQTASVWGAWIRPRTRLFVTISMTWLESRTLSRVDLVKYNYGIVPFAFDCLELSHGSVPWRVTLSRCQKWFEVSYEFWNSTYSNSFHFNCLFSLPTPLHTSNQWVKWNKFKFQNADICICNNCDWLERVAIYVDVLLIGSGLIASLIDTGGTRHNALIVAVVLGNLKRIQIRKSLMRHSLYIHHSNMSLAIWLLCHTNTEIQEVMKYDN